MVDIYGKVFNKLVDETESYMRKNNLKSMVLGVSGGIDSTVCAAICSEVSKRTGIPLIGRSLSTKNNKAEEITTADLVGNAFCTDYKRSSFNKLYNSFLMDIVGVETGRLKFAMDESGNVNIDDEHCMKVQTPVANGNIQARIRMIFLYNLASINNGLVIDTDNLTEHYLGYWTIHGDVGDYNPIGNLWKTEVYGLARWLYSHYLNDVTRVAHEKATAMAESIGLTPTAGLGITNSDLEEIGANSYDEVDKILQFIVDSDCKTETKFFKKEKDFNEWYITRYTNLCDSIGEEIVLSVIERYRRSSFKRKNLPIRIELRKQPTEPLFASL